jgi:hypothetical protein
LVLALLVLAFVIPESSDATLVARRRRGRRYRRRRARSKRRNRRRAKPAKPAKPAPAPKAEPSSDLENNPTKSSGGQVDPGALRRGGRVEFDGRLVQGQTAKSGAIYLFARKKTELKSMVDERSSYRKEVLRTVYPRWSKPKKKGKDK